MKYNPHACGQGTKYMFGNYFRIDSEVRIREEASGPYANFKTDLDKKEVDSNMSSIIRTISEITAIYKFLVLKSYEILKL